MAWISFDRSVPGGAIVQLACAELAPSKSATAKIAIGRIDSLLMLQQWKVGSKNVLQQDTLQPVILKIGCPTQSG
jgi:hypothetical protein